MLLLFRVSGGCSYRGCMLFITIIVESPIIIVVEIGIDGTIGAATSLVVIAAAQKWTIPWGIIDRRRYSRRSLLHCRSHQLVAGFKPATLTIMSIIFLTFLSVFLESTQCFRIEAYWDSSYVIPPERSCEDRQSLFQDTIDIWSHVPSEFRTANLTINIAFADFDPDRLHYYSLLFNFPIHIMS